MLFLPTTIETTDVPFVSPQALHVFCCAPSVGAYFFEKNQASLKKKIRYDMSDMSCQTCLTYDFFFLSFRYSHMCMAI